MEELTHRRSTGDLATPSMPIRGQANRAAEIGEEARGQIPRKTRCC